MRLGQAVGLVLAVVAFPPPLAARSIAPWWQSCDYSGVEEVEALLFRYTNDERRKRKLPQLQPLPALQIAARQHSAEMLREDYFSHTSPHADWATPSQRAYRAGLWEGQAAENIVYMKTEGFTIGNAELAREMMYGADGWMNSTGHRENILNPDYTHLGLGVSIGGGRYLATQLFAEPYYDLSELDLSAVGDQWQLSGRARLLRATDRVYVAVDRRLVEVLDLNGAKAFRFKVQVPRDGERHRVGLHPAKSANSFWLKFLFHLDTAAKLEEALVMPEE